ncbi:putative importin subunit alpha A [Cavenderia fasciculata]|uniref:Importin subunit alpha n=1 Tax=Cavenderia fasciculata TaxID=261658 RepID=F4PP63_CACFS|nr:putative importin subunit alpha A [Cavenderia fasciculata]EGG22176.1 putative importin subunit alpha A [Cavenderia fasciculata]|eukprot:XP_004360027.1 putative importin subunit alpha A [Cavenderia fasciculata]
MSSLTLRDKQDSRKKDFKKGIDTDSARRKREEITSSIRKSARDEALQKKRNLVATTTTLSTSGSVSQQDEIAVPADIQAQFDEFEKKTIEVKLKALPELTAALNSNDQAIVFSALVQFRKLLCLEKNPPIDEVISCGVIPRFNQLLSNSGGYTKVQFEAAWALTNIVSGSNNQTEAVVSSGSIPIFISLLASSSEEVQEQCTWALGNVAGDSIQGRDMVLRLGALPALLKIASTPNISRPTLLQNVVWTVSNLCRGNKPHPDFSLVSPAIPVLANLFKSEDVSDELLADLCWAFSYLSDGENFKIQAVVNAGAVPSLVHLLAHPKSLVYTPALRAIGNIVTGDASQTQVAIEAGAISLLGDLLTNQRRSIRKETCWTLSNITAGNSPQIESVFSNKRIVALLVNILLNGENEVKREACWALSNATNGTAKHIATMVNEGVLKPLCETVQSNDVTLVKVSLEALGNILHQGNIIASKSGVNPYTLMIEEYGGDQAFIELQSHKNPDIYQKASQLLEQYFDCDDEYENENDEPNSAFSFPSSNRNVQISL